MKKDNWMEKAKIKMIEISELSDKDFKKHLQ